MVDVAGLSRVALPRKAGEALRAPLVGRALRQLDGVEAGLRVVGLGREVGREGNFAAGDALVPSENIVIDKMSIDKQNVRWRQHTF